MLQLILGRSGSGKTEYVQKLLTQKAKTQCDKLLMIVPEQLSFDTETAFLDSAGAIMGKNIQVLSFSRMADFVFRQIGGLGGTAIDDGSRSVIMSLAIEQAQDNLDLYKKQASRPELVNLMLGAVNEFKMCCVTSDNLRLASVNTDNTTLKKKLTETALIMDIYNALVEKSYIDPLDNLTRLYNIILSNPLFEGYTVAIDAFSGFTMQEKKLLSCIISQSKDCFVTVCTDKAEYQNKSKRFTTTNNTVKELIQMAHSINVPVSAPIYLEENKRGKNPELVAIEKEIFNPNCQKHRLPNENVKIYCANDIYEESTYAACEIKRLVTEENYRYKDIAVVTRSLEPYRGVLDCEFDKFGIGYFMDKPQDIVSKPLIAMVLSAFDIVHSSFAAENILHFLKTGLTSFSADNIALLENYVYVWSINGSRWLQEFTANPNGYSDEFSESDKKNLEKIENTRKKIIDPLIKFKNAIQNTNGKHISLALYNLLGDFFAEQNIKNYSEYLLDKGEIEAAHEQIRIWDIFIDVLDQLCMISEKINLTSKRYSELLKMMLNSRCVSFIPQGMDQVIVGTADRIRLNSPKAVFVMGAIYGEFPSTPVNAGIFSQAERKSLILMDLPLYGTNDTLAANELFFAYTAVAACQNRLYVTYYEMNLKGELLMPSQIVNDISEILPMCPIITGKEEDPFEGLWCRDQAFGVMAQNFGDNSGNTQLLRQYFETQPDYADKTEILKHLADKTPLAIKNHKTAKELFGSTMRLSASQIEKFYLCSFQYFCRYGLHTKERKKAQIDAGEYGTLIHAVLENVLMNNEIEELAEKSDNEIFNMVSNLIDQYLETHMGGAQDKTTRYLQSFDRIKQAAAAVTAHIIAELAQSKFVPTDFELNIGGDEVKSYSLPLPDGGSVDVIGYVDRVDIYKKDNKAYIRIIDYKTNEKKFVLSDVMFGLNLQMLLYLSALAKNGNEHYKMPVVPAGVLYMPAGESYIKIDGDITDDIIAKNKNAYFRMNGLVLEDTDVICAMEEKGKGVYLPVSIKEVADKPKKGEEPKPPVLVIKGEKNAVNPEQMEFIFNKIDSLICDMASNLLKGQIAPLPAKSKSYDACQYCPYINICAYVDGMDYKDVSKTDVPLPVHTQKEEAE